MIRQILTALAIALGLIAAPTPSIVETSVITEVEPAEADEWLAYEREAFSDYARQFDVLFSSYEVKRTKNNRLMIRQGDSGSFKFARKA
jgi:hypothetical protein